MRNIVLIFLLFVGIIGAHAQNEMKIELPVVIVEGVGFDLIIDLDESITWDSEIPILVNGQALEYEVKEERVSNVTENSGTFNEYIDAEKGSRVITIKNVPTSSTTIKIEYGEHQASTEINPVPLWMSILPPLIAIVLALLLKEVISSLFIGILSGTLVMSFYGQGFTGLFSGFLSTVDKYIMNALNDWSHIAVIVFSMSIAAVVSIISKNGGMRGVVNRLEPYAKNPRSGQFVIWLMGVLIFFDDYANTLVVGNTMRPVADRLSISREKLAYLVDSTAAPVAAIAFITTWIGAELGYIESGLNYLPELDMSPYAVFLQSLQYAFYPIFTLVFMLILIYKKSDYGPMLKAELKARKLGKVDEEDVKGMDSEFVMKEGVTPKSYNAVIPILIVIIGAVWGMWITGMDATDAAQLEGESFFRRLSIIIGNSDSFTALLWSSLSGMAAAVVLTVTQKIMTLDESIQSGLGGFKTMIPAMIILILAWALAGVTQDMHTAVFLQGLWSDSLSPIFIPAVVFVLSAVVAFSTGSSWGTMAILYPLLLPASYHIAIEGGMGHDEAMIVFYNVVSVVLAGSVFGDHVSPISDTTILSSLATSCNHIDHVKTQMPYAITVGLVAIFIGSIPAAMGVSSYITFPVGISVLYAIVHFFGKPTEI